MLFRLAVFWTVGSMEEKGRPSVDRTGAGGGPSGTQSLVVRLPVVSIASF